MTKAPCERAGTNDSDAALPQGTVIARPLRHVRAVRERYMQRFADPSEAAAHVLHEPGDGHWGRPPLLR